MKHGDADRQLALSFDAEEMGGYETCREYAAATEAFGRGTHPDGGPGAA